MGHLGVGWCYDDSPNVWFDRDLISCLSDMDKHYSTGQSCGTDYDAPRVICRAGSMEIWIHNTNDPGGQNLVTCAAVSLTLTNILNSDWCFTTNAPYSYKFEGNRRYRRGFSKIVLDEESLTNYGTEYQVDSHDDHQVEVIGSRPI
jgi:hypothetical protein